MICVRSPSGAHGSTAAIGRQAAYPDLGVAKVMPDSRGGLSRSGGSFRSRSSSMSFRLPTCACARCRQAAGQGASPARALAGMNAAATGSPPGQASEGVPRCCPQSRFRPGKLPRPGRTLRRIMGIPRPLRGHRAASRKGRNDRIGTPFAPKRTIVYVVPGGPGRGQTVSQEPLSRPWERRLSSAPSGGRLAEPSPACPGGKKKKPWPRGRRPPASWLSCTGVTYSTGGPPAGTPTYTSDSVPVGWASVPL